MSSMFKCRLKKWETFVGGGRNSGELAVDSLELAKKGVGLDESVARSGEWMARQHWRGSPDLTLL
ncbi:hypothetical protein M378DRAFT_172296 [Amanita muscaria Koide BX008]|uniref:Uncharacterized protein n=1 Tax=Amanita muscaria (strain Koide BX008) TaxID=946122 RepID=A0A0C2WL76_AMAMK|nr:hypothetical protein M378DRAFT_172296 [Amanita muscaria Koide BX008]